MTLAVRLWSRIASRLPQPRVIYDREGRTPYLSRYYLTARPRMPDGSEPFESGQVRSGVLERERFCSIFLHRFHRGDDDLALHNHPWHWAVSIVLAGGYIEERRTETGAVERRKVRPGSVNVILNSTYHRVELLESECYSLFIAGPRIPGWNFWERDTGRTVPWRQFIDELRSR
jgi:hypothetical protein